MIVAQHLGVEAGRVKFDARLVVDLGANSLDIVELVMALEDEFAVSVDDERAEKMETVDDAVRIVEESVDRSAPRGGA